MCTAFFQRSYIVPTRFHVYATTPAFVNAHDYFRRLLAVSDTYTTVQRLGCRARRLRWAWQAVCCKSRDGAALQLLGIV